MQGQKPYSHNYDYSTGRDSKPKDRPVTLGEQLELDERKRIDRLDENARKRQAYVVEGAGTESSIHGDTFEGRQEYIPLQQRSNSPYPIHALPAPAQRYVRNLADYTDTDLAMPAQFLLGFVSGCNRKQLVARFGSYTRPINLGICNFAASTTGKSFVLREIQREFLSAQKQISQDRQSLILDRLRSVACHNSFLGDSIR